MYRVWFPEQLLRKPLKNIAKTSIKEPKWFIEKQKRKRDKPKIESKMADGNPIIAMITLSGSGFSIQVERVMFTTLDRI